MAISETDIKLLWGRAAGRCSNPDCGRDLTSQIEKSPLVIGEMAHIIAKSADGPRGKREGQTGSDRYDNLILLCPTCHTKIDKAPEHYPEEVLRQWRQEHEKHVSEQDSTKLFDNLAALKSSVSSILLENRALWKTLGPKSEIASSNPGSNLHEVWTLRKIDTIVPNNRRIVNLVEANKALLDRPDLEAFLEFKVHAEAFEQHQYNRLDEYPQFPAIFDERFMQ